MSHVQNRNRSRGLKKDGLLFSLSSEKDQYKENKDALIEVLDMIIDGWRIIYFNEDITSSQTITSEDIATFSMNLSH